MEWWHALILLFGALAILALMGLPVAFAFLAVNIIAVILLWGGQKGLIQLILSIHSSVSTFILVPVVMFILMGEVVFRSGVAYKTIDIVDEWVGRVPGRLGIVSVIAGTIFATLTGVAMGSVAMLGSTLMPEMERRGYDKSMTIGPILASGTLAIMIPPSALAVLLASLAEFSIGRLLIAIIIPGLMMAGAFALYIIVRCTLQPSLAPTYEVKSSPFRKKMMDFVRYVLPLGSVIIVVIGFIFLGVSSPTEAAALGALMCFLLAAVYKKLNWDVIKKTLGGTTSIAVMVLMLLTGATAFSQVLAFSGATTKITEMAMNLSLSPLVMLILMQVVIFVMGMLMNQTPIMMITLPVFMPIVRSLGWNPIWFGAIMLLNLEMATISPPFGLSLFVMKGVAPPHITMSDIYRSVIPFLLVNILIMVLMIAFPPVILWLPSVMMK